MGKPASSNDKRARARGERKSPIKIKTVRRDSETRPNCVYKKQRHKQKWKTEKRPRLRRATRACSGCLRPHRGSQQGALGRGRPREGVTALNVGTWHLAASQSGGPGAPPENRQGSGQVRSWNGSFRSPSGTRPHLVTSSHIAAFRPVPQGKEQRHPERKGQPPTPRGRTLRGGPERSAAKAAAHKGSTQSHLSPALPRGRSEHWKRVFLKNTFTVASNV